MSLVHTEISKTQHTKTNMKHSVVIFPTCIIY